VLVMTHAAKPPPDGQNGPMDYDAYINHRMNALQQGVRSALCSLSHLNFGGLLPATACTS
jgi:hypothetical protein